MSENTAYKNQVPVPRQYSFVKFDYDNLPKVYHSGYPFSKKHRYIFLGEIPNMRDHCIVMDDQGKVYTGYHIENFVELTDENEHEYSPVGYLPK